MLKSRLLIPKIDDTIRRERFNKTFDEMRRKPLTTVVAGAGYGKTTLVAQAVAYLNVPVAWYHADPWDAEPGSLFRDLSVSIQTQYPGFENTAVLFKGTATATPRKQRAALLAWLQALERCVTDNLIIVIDDFQHFRGNDAVTEAFSFLMTHLPARVGWVFVSRSEPRLRLSTFRARRQLVEITETDLMFTRKETRRLFNETLQADVEPELLDGIHTKSSGWASGLVLFHHIFRNRSHRQIAELLDGFTGSVKSLAAYLEDNVYNVLSSDIKRFLIKASVFSYLERRLCDKVFGIGCSGEILEFLTKHHLFTYALDDKGEAFYFHQLFREFLQSRLEAKHTRDEIGQLHITVARAYVDTGRTLEAVHHFFLAGKHKESARLIEENGLSLILQGRLRQVTVSLDQFTDSIMQARPRLMQLKGLTLFLSGRLKDSQAVLKTALRSFQHNGDTMGAAACRKDLALHYYYAGDVRQAILQLQQVTEEDISPMLAMEANGLLVFLSSVLGRLDAADDFHKAAMHQLHLLDHGQRAMGKAFIRLNESYRFCISGDFSRSMDIAQKALTVFRAGNLEVFLPLTYFQLSYTGFFLRRFETGYDYAVSGLDVAESVGVHDNQVAWLHLAKALNCTGMGKNREAVDNALESLEIFEEMGNPWGQAMAHEALSWAKFHTPSLQHEAVPHILAGLSAIKGLRHHVTEGLLNWGLARYRSAVEPPEELLSILSTALKRVASSKFYTAMILLQKARCFYRRGDLKNAGKHLTSALVLSRDHGYDGWILAEKHWLSPILEEVSGLGYMETRVCERFIQRGETVQRSKVPGLRICLLGAFNVSVGDRPIAPEQWRSKKAKTLFKYLAVRMDSGFIQRDELIEALWPDEPPEKTANRFHVTLNALRRILEPGLTRGTPSAYIVKEENAYKLIPGDGGGIDADEFEATANAAASAPTQEGRLELLLKAASIYHGPYLQEDPYSEWCQALRRRLETVHLDVLSRIVDAYEAQHAWRQCVTYALRYLDDAYYAENMYRRLMRFHAELGEKAMVVRVYDRCRLAIEKDLGGELSPETIALYRASI